MLQHVAVFARMPQHSAKAPRVSIAENELVEDPVDMVVLRSRRQMRQVAQHSQRTGHAQVHNEPARVDFEQQVLAAPLDLVDHMAPQGFRKVGRNRPAQRGRADVDALNPASGDVRFDSASGNLNFWQLWHV